MKTSQFPFSPGEPLSSKQQPSQTFSILFDHNRASFHTLAKREGWTRVTIVWARLRLFKAQAGLPTRVRHRAFRWASSNWRQGYLRHQTIMAIEIMKVTNVIKKSQSHQQQQSQQHNNNNNNIITTTLSSLTTCASCRLTSSIWTRVSANKSGWTWRGESTWNEIFEIVVADLWKQILLVFF